MKRIIFLKSTYIALLGLLGLSIMLSCGSASKKEQARQQEIEDSLKLDQERRELMERANQMLQKADSISEQQASENPD